LVRPGLGMRGEEWKQWNGSDIGAGMSLKKGNIERKRNLEEKGLHCLRATLEFSILGEKEFERNGGKVSKRQ